MTEVLNEKSLRKPRILIAPLDWGLGHATRCIPLIRELLANECDVWLAGEGVQNKLFAREFPELTILDLSGYNIKYSKTKAGLFFRLVGQIEYVVLQFQIRSMFQKDATASCSTLFNILER